MRKLIVTGVAVLALMAPMTGCSSSKKKSSGNATKADLVRGFEANKIPKDKANCLADKIYPQLSQTDLNALKNSATSGTASAKVTQVITQAAADCGVTGGSGTSGAS